ncbi:hypothetical protein KUTeg_001155, partial [Tegillarca granosa]
MENTGEHQMAFSSSISKIGTKAVRQFFDKHIPSNDLKQKLAKEKGKLQKLKGHVIYDDQWDILYQSIGTVSSSDFDLTLMLLLLREIGKVNKPTNGGSKLPHQHDKSDGARLATIKYYRNELAHTKDFSISRNEFKRTWNDLREAIVGIGGKTYNAEINEVRTLSLDQSHKDLYKELKIFQDQKIATWKQDDESFFPTRATSDVMNHINHNNVTIVTGPPGCGKKATMHHLALQYKQDNYQIFYVTTIDKIFDLWIRDGKQLFLLENPFGDHDIDKSELHKWENQEDMDILFEYSDIKIIASVRSHIIQDDLLTCLSDTAINITDPNICLTNEERREIFKKHALYQKRNDLLNMSTEVESYTVSCFPLVCQRFTASKDSTYSTEEFFNEHLQVIRKEIKKFQINEKTLYFCLLFCMIYDNNLDTEIISLSRRDEASKIVRDDLLDVCKVKTGKTEIKSTLDTLLNTYLRKEGSSYQFIHDIVHDAVVGHVDQLPLEIKKEVILKHCTSKFIKERTVLSSLDTNRRSDGKVIITEELENVWGVHIINSITEGYWGDVFTNTCLQTDQADILLKRILKKLGNDSIRAFVRKRNVSSNEGIVSYLFLPPYTDSIVSRLTEAECSSLHLVVLCGLVRLTEVIINLVNVSNENSYINLLLLACLSGKDKMVTIFLKRNDSSSYFTDGITPLILSSGKGNKKIVEILIQHGASVNMVEKKYGHSPLHVAAVYGYPNIVDLLIRKEADVNLLDKRNDSALHLASKNGHVNVVNALLKGHADVGQVDADGYSALHLASKNGDENVVNALLHGGANVNKIVKDNSNFPLNQHIDDGVYYDSDGDHGISALHLASEKGNLDVVNALLQGGANVNQVDFDGYSALHLASKNDHANVVVALLQEFANVNQIVKDRGTSALHLASEEGYLDVVNALLQGGANVNQVDFDGYSALHLASKNDHANVVVALLQGDAEDFKIVKKNNNPVIYDHDDDDDDDDDHDHDDDDDDDDYDYYDDYDDDH